MHLLYEFIHVDFFNSLLTMLLLGKVKVKALYMKKYFLSSMAGDKNLTKIRDILSPAIDAENIFS